MKIDKRKIVFDIYENIDLPFGRWATYVDILFLMRWSDNQEDLVDPNIGFIGVDLTNKNIPTVSFTYMKQIYRGKGLGMYMYEKALQYFDKLSTTYTGSNMAISTDAQKVWDKLMLKYKTKIPRKNANGGIVVFSQQIAG